ncbi:MAG: ABC transporter permease [Bacteroidia bacterium]
MHDPVIKTDGKKLGETKVYYADAGVFQLFELGISQGSLETWSDNAHQVIISQSMADKYFPQKNPIGNYLEFEGLGEIQVKGVFRESKETAI